MDPITEGSTRLFPLVASGPALESGGPGTHDRDVPFYNPAMALNRDLSVLLVAAECARRGRELDVADVLAGAGARSLRLAKEIDAPLIVHANDGDPNGIAAIQEGIAANGIAEGRIQTTNGNAHTFLATRRYDIVDVDPFGSSQPFLDSAVHAARHNGLVCLTATDTGALCGTYAKACRRRYGAEPLHKPAWRAEVGLRILIANAVRAAGRIDKCATPVLSVAQGHWMRVVLRITDGRKDADDAAKQVGFVQEDPELPMATFTDAGAGPIWVGALHDGETLQAMAADDRSLAHPKTRALLNTLVQEADSRPFWLHIPHLHSTLGGTVMPKQAIFIAALHAEGAQTSATHMDVQGVRTDATPEQVRAAWKACTTQP